MTHPNVKSKALTTVDYDPFADSASLARVVPTTEAQREIWLACQLGDEASLAYNESISLHLHGELDITALRRALQALVDRHDALRATFSPDGQDLYLADGIRLGLAEHDLTALPQADREQAVRQRLHAEVNTPFDLERGPLLRAQLLRLQQQHAVLILTAHHIVCDGWSFGVLATELMALYAGFISEQEAAALPPAGSFGDYALAQVDPEHAAVAGPHTQWWVDLYDRSVPILDLPIDRPRPVQRGFASQREDLEFDAELVEALRRLAMRNGTSLFVLMLSAFAGMIARLSRQNDVVIGVPTAGQASAGSSASDGALVGHCVQLLPLRLPIDPEQSFEALMDTTRGRVLDAYEHQSCTFGSLLKRLRLDRDPSRLPLVSVVFNLDTAIRAEYLSRAGLKVEMRSNSRDFENFELFVNASQIGRGIVLECQYNSALFDAGTVQRWLRLYREALTRAVAHTGQTLAQLFAPTKDDLALLARFNATAAEFPRNSRIESLIASQAARTPDAVALVAGSRRLSYRELDQRANAVAAALRERGVGKLVGLCCGRNEHLLIGLLGILKSGAGYVPLDPAFPAGRLEYMCADAGLRCIVADRPVADAWKIDAVQALPIDDLGSLASLPPAPGGAEDVAYVIYTSGSTGQPKGVQVAHRSVVNLLESVRREPGMTTANVVLSVTTLSFDIAVSEVILPLTVGARVVLADRAQATDGTRLRQLIERERVDFIDATPSTWRLLLDAGWRGSEHLKAVCTGEPLPPDIGRELLSRVGELWNGYGPTETTVWSSFHRVLCAEAPVPIGRPIANTQVHVVDEQLRRLPVGVAGELFIGGEGVTLGYLGRPELTTQHFPPDPFRGIEGARGYRTGDLGRWRIDGVLECLGRRDQQVKVRGYRIELGEIEASLQRHPDIERATVITREDEPGDVRLVAYVVARHPRPDTRTLREFLRQSLPDYMIPSHVILLDALPLLPNGKLDRRSLPAPHRVQVVPAPDRVAPRNAIEAKVLAAMEDVLKLPDLSVLDDFFTLGGHSLLAARLVARLKRELDVDLALRAVFESPTAERLAQAAEQARIAGLRARAPIQRDPQRTSAPLTPMQQRIAMMEEMYPGRVVYNAPSAHRLIGSLDLAAFERALREVVQRQPVLRTRIVRDAEKHWQEILPEAVLDLPLEDLSGGAQAEQEQRLMQRLQALCDQVIDIHQAPLFHARLLRLSDHEHVFFFMPHHVIWDGWSFDLLYTEMAAAYGAIIEGRDNPLPPLPATYADFSEWQAAWLHDEAAEQLSREWQRRLICFPTPQSLNTDKPRRPGMSGNGATELVRIDPATTDRLRAIAQQADVTLNMLMLALYGALIADLTAGSATVIGVPVRGRAQPELESVMGFFNNLLPLPVRLDRRQPVYDFLRAVKSDLVESTSFDEIPFEHLASRPEVLARTRGAGLYQALFSFQDARQRTRRWGNLVQANIPIFQQGATEDLGLWLMEGPTGLEGGFIYNTDIYTARTAAAFRLRYLELVQRVTEHPKRTLADLLNPQHSSAAPVLAHLRPEPEAAAAVRQTQHTQERRNLTAAEQRLARVWAAVLGLDAEQIGPQDNFFDLGGASLQAMHSITRMYEQTGRRIDARRMVTETLEQIAKAYDGAGAGPQMVAKGGLLRRLISRAGRPRAGDV
ncbi:MAG: amino acid adenylation domain-containing protein [Gammaproteobacteria bacterium]|nr:amino acid adenylation domain-containing protein [Gammaproteobacteria bacterium]